tara:strand:+ start:176 stop:346 length:171 start_codon:yes stop_codon:yes gene_type:complete
MQKETGKRFYVLTIVSKKKNIQGVSFECHSIKEMMKKKEQLFKMGVLSRARITNKQ